jgi:two-component system sensor histidine kinase CreC
VTIRTKVFLVFIAAMIGGVGLLEYWVSDDFNYRYSESFEEVLVDSTNLLAEQVARAWKQPVTERFRDLDATMASLGRRTISARIFEFEKTNSDIRVYVTDAAGRLLYDSQAGHSVGEDYSNWLDVSRTLKGEYGARTTREQAADAQGVSQQVSVAYVGAPVVVDGQVVGVVSMGKPKTNIERFIAHARRQLLIAVGVALSGAILLGLLLYVWVTRPLQALIEYANRVSAGASVALPRLGDNEIGRVGEAMESMRQALEDKKYVEGYVQSLTHEIRSPLTAIRASAELLRNDIPAEARIGFSRSIESEVDRLSAIVNRLLELAAVERANRLEHEEPLALFAICREVLASAQTQADRRGVRLETSFAGEDLVAGDRLLLAQAVDNLLRNALDFSSAGGAISMEGSGDERAVTLVVRDQGSGIPEYAQSRIFERFYSLPRPDTGRKSTGLGLNFVREVAELHGGTISIESSDKGTVARLVLPRRAGSRKA